ncbi:MAG: FlgD immunoglobulin-like domain containing protein [Candidatus Limnocylindrales bacterium]
MRKLVIAVAALLVGSLGVLVPAGAAPASAAAANPKVAIIVGATGSVTATYRTYADQLYAEAIKYTTNVVKVYSPNATWSRVKSAVNGASIIVYLGHGNGWPAPYPNDATYSQKDGFGLNYDTNGDGRLTDSELRYYGEPSIRTLTPAPNAVVLLFHLCYASGNSEPGLADPTLSVARQRADNYAAAFQAMGARAVIAIGHSHDPYYIRALFTTRESIRQYWTQAPGYHNHVLQYASVRTPGRTELLDPDYATPAGFWRSLTGDMTLNTADVTGASYASTGGDPSSMVVPGNATPTADGTPLYGTLADAAAGTNPTTTLAASTIVRVDAKEPVTASVDGSPIYAVHLDDATAGWMRGSTLTPRDSAAPRLWTVDDGTGAFSPDGNGVGDTLPISLRLSEVATWTLAIVDDAGTKLATSSGQADTATITWAPAAHSVPDGTYHWQLTATDAYGNGPLKATGDITVDTAVPALTVAGATTPQVFSPNRDGVQESVGFGVTSTKDGTAQASIRNAGGSTVAALEVPLNSLRATVTWDGTTSAGAAAPDGVYSVRLTVRDLAGNTSGFQDRQVVVDRTLGFAKASRALFFPQDGDNLTPTTAFSFKLAGPATVDWTIVDARGVVVRTIRTHAALAAGSYGYTWNGRNNAGSYVARGTYRSVVVSTDALATQTLQAAVVADAFKIAVSDTTPGRGQTITVTATSAEGLAAAPRLAVIQPGIAIWSASMTRVSTGVYRVSIRLRSSHTGTLRLKVYGKDSAGQAQYSNLYLPLH